LSALVAAMNRASVWVHLDRLASLLFVVDR